MSPGWAGRLVAGAASLRTLAYRLASPLERWLRPPPAGEPAPPPLWLRRHAGRVRAFRSSAADAARLLDRLGLVAPDTVVLDFGCGPGAMVPELARRLGARGRYLGLDVHPPSIRWCSEAWSADPRLSFALLAAPGTAATGGDRWPAPSGGFDLVLAKSVFTHLLEPAARAALAEVRRVLRTEGRALVTAFTFDEPSFAGRELPWFPWSVADDAVRWRRRGRPTAAVAFSRTRFESLLAEAGLGVVTFVRGYFPGGDAPPSGQDTFVLAPGAAGGTAPAPPASSSTR